MMSRLICAVLAVLALAGPARAAVDIQEVTSPGGITAWLVEEHEIPFVVLEIRFKGGASLDAEGKRGAINLMTALLEEGAGDMNAQAFAAAQEELAASFSFDVHSDALTISARFLSENRDAALALLKTALTEPRFDTAAIERVRAQVLSNIRAELNDPDEIAGNAYNARIFAGHPYATSIDGTLESVAALAREDLVAAHRAVLSRDKLFVGAVGDVTTEELGQMLDDLLGGLPETGAPEPARAEPVFDGGITVVPWDVPQSIAIFGQPGIARDDPDFFPAFVMSTIFGAGGFESRLMDEVRVQRGLTYGIGAGLSGRDYADVMTGSVASSNESIAEAIEVVQAEWVKLAERGVTQEELDRAIKYLTGAYPLRFDGNANIARILVGMQMTDLGLDYIATRNDKVRAVTLEDVRRVAAELIDPEALTFVVVGQPVGLETTN